MKDVCRLGIFGKKELVSIGYFNSAQAAQTQTSFNDILLAMGCCTARLVQMPYSQRRFKLHTSIVSELMRLS